MFALAGFALITQAARHELVLPVLRCWKRQIGLGFSAQKGSACAAKSGGQGGSQGGSQQAQTQSDVRPCPATVIAGKRYARRRRATSSVRTALIWEQEAAGSNPAIPTRFFECVVSLCKQGATRRRLLLDSGRRGWVAVQLGCPLAPLL